MTKSEFIKLTEKMKTLFPKDSMVFTKEIIVAWYECLKDIDFRRASEGLVLYAQESNWIPTIADIRKYANKIPKYTKEEIHNFIVEAEKKEREKLDSVRF